MRILYDNCEKLQPCDCARLCKKRTKLLAHNEGERIKGRRIALFLIQNPVSNATGSGKTGQPRLDLLGFKLGGEALHKLLVLRAARKKDFHPVVDP